MCFTNSAQLSKPCERTTSYCASARANSSFPAPPLCGIVNEEQFYKNFFGSTLAFQSFIAQRQPEAKHVAITIAKRKFLNPDEAG